MEQNKHGATMFVELTLWSTTICQQNAIHYNDTKEKNMYVMVN
jgi:hypothetical protein